MLIPSIDLMGGRIVQLVQGEKLKLAFDDFEYWIERFSKYPVVQLIDLDAAMQQGENRALIEMICKRLPCQVGGGLRTAADGRAPQRTVVIRHGGGGEFLSLLIQRIDYDLPVEPDAAAALVVLIKTTGSPAHLVAEFLSEMFSLTRREGEVAVRLMQGDSLYEAADALGVTRATARVHIRSIFSKTFGKS